MPQHYVSLPSEVLKRSPFCDLDMVLGILDPEALGSGVQHGDSRGSRISTEGYASAATAEGDGCGC